MRPRNAWKSWRAKRLIMKNSALFLLNLIGSVALFNGGTAMSQPAAATPAASSVLVILGGIRFLVKRREGDVAAGCGNSGGPVCFKRAGLRGGGRRQEAR